MAVSPTATRAHPAVSCERKKRKKCKEDKQHKKRKQHKQHHTTALSAG